MPANTGKMVIGSGGYVEIGVVSSAGFDRVDVETWFLNIRHITKAVAHSGCRGVMARKTVIQDWDGGFRYSYLDKTADGNGGGNVALMQAGAEIKIRFLMNNGDAYQGVAIVTECKPRSTSGPDEADVDVVKYDVTIACAGVLAAADGGPANDNPVTLAEPIKLIRA